MTIWGDAVQRQRPKLGPAARHRRLPPRTRTGALRLDSLAEARELALADRKRTRSGGDPPPRSAGPRACQTSAEAAEAVLEQNRGGWRGRWHGQN